MGFSTNYDDVQDYDLIPKGEYEVIIKQAYESETQNCKKRLVFQLFIRNDVDQKFQNRCIFHTLWKRKEPTQADLQVQGYSFKQIMQLAKAAKLPNGKSYETVKDLCDDLINHVVRVTIDHEEYNGKTNERVKYMNSSKFPECKHVYKEKKAVSSNTFASAGSLEDFEEILSDGDVPF